VQMRLVVLTAVLAAGISKPAVDARALGDALEAAAHLAQPAAASAALHFKAAKARDHHKVKASLKPKFLLPTTPAPPTVKLSAVDTAVSPLLAHNAANVDFSDSDLTDLADEISNIGRKRNNVSTSNATQASSSSSHLAVNGTAAPGAHSGQSRDEIQQLTAELVADAAAAKGTQPAKSNARAVTPSKAAPLISKPVAPTATAVEDPQHTIDKALEYFAAPHTAGPASSAADFGRVVSAHAKSAASIPTKAAAAARTQAAGTPTKSAGPTKAAATAPTKAVATTPTKAAATTPTKAAAGPPTKAAARALAKSVVSNATHDGAKSLPETSAKSVGSVSAEKALAEHINSTSSQSAHASDASGRAAGAAVDAHPQQFAEPATRQVLERNERTQVEKVGDAVRGLMEQNPLEIEPPTREAQATKAEKHSVAEDSKHGLEAPTSWFGEVRSALSTYFR